MIEKNGETQYLDLMRQILQNGVERTDRTGIGTKGIWGAHVRFDLSQGFPLITTRQIALRIAFEEMMFFMRGQTDTKVLEDKKITIWQGNTTREFLDNKGLTHLPVGDMGKGYGWQLRNFDGDAGDPGVDQLALIIENIKKNPNDRRHMFSFWNPNQVLNQAALPPCHFAYNAQIADGKLNGLMTIRSWDTYHGGPYNIAGYAFLTHWLAAMTGYVPGTLVISAADAHIYTHQFEAVEEQLTKTQHAFPQFRFKKEFSTLEEGLALQFEDVEITGYQHEGKQKKIPMAV